MSVVYRKLSYYEMEFEHHAEVKRKEKDYPDTVYFGSWQLYSLTDGRRSTPTILFLHCKFAPTMHSGIL